MSTFATVFQASRPNFLVLTPLCMMLGLATASIAIEDINYVDFAIAIIGGILADISVNTWNEYEDYKSGLDLTTNRTPFSGGSGALPENPDALSAVFSTAVITLGITFAIGCYFFTKVGLNIVPLGLLGLLIIVSYTGWINRRAFICLIAPGLAFGPLMVIGTHLVLTGSINYQVLLLSLVPFFMVNNLLLLNQFPDIDADAKVGRAHFSIRYGVANATKVYGFFTLAAVASLLYSTLANGITHWALIAIVPMVLMMISFKGARSLGKEVATQPQYMGLNVISNLVTPLIISLAILLGQRI